MKYLISLSLLSLSLFVVACGVDPSLEGGASTDEAIVGGSTFSGLPAIGALLIQSADGEELCTATLIAPRKVVTAGHCSAGVAAADATFVIGTNVDQPQYTLKVASIQAHPSYNDSTIANDIGLVTLAEDAPSSITPLPLLASMDQSYIGKPFFFVGYGVTNGTTQTGDGLKRAVSMAVSKIKSTQFQYNTPGKNTCNGDSGGPALYQSGGTYYIAGVTSYGDAGCKQYGVDTRVDTYLSFLGVAGTNP
jgi:secreted trypsin-like serine protease